MRWRQTRRSSNVEDRRGRSVGRPVAMGGGLTILLFLAVMLLGGDGNLLALLQQVTGGSTAQVGGAPGRPLPADTDEAAEFVAHVLGDTEDTWTKIFSEAGRRYREPELVLFTDAVASACGMNRSAVGPFYCPADYKVYIDLSFFNDLHRRFGAPGDFAQAYVIAHEVGHHVQNLLGISDQVRQQQQRMRREEANALSVRLELQADCLAGIWGRYAHGRGLLETGDVEEGLRAAAAIGDDRIQRQSTGHVNPESWTHGSSEQRVEWFRRGLEAGRFEACDTFGGA